MGKTFLRLLFFLSVATRWGQGEEPGAIIGIDLGGTFSRVGFFQEGSVETNKLGSQATPSWVAFDGHSILIGEEAKRYAATNPERSLFGIRQLLGREFSDPLVQHEMKLLPFDVVNRKGKPHLSMRVDGEEMVFAPEEILAIILKEMKGIAEAQTGKSVEIAFISVPCSFNDDQRQAIKDAASAAGLNQTRTITEPFAATIAHVHLDQEDFENIFVYDLGGGTLSVSVLEVDFGILDVLSCVGDIHLGGKNFDQRVMEHLLREFEMASGLDCSRDRAALQMLLEESEKAKRALSQQHQALLHLKAFCQGVDFSSTLTRSKFEELNMDLFQKTLVIAQAALDGAGLSKDEINKVVLAGGSTAIPKVRELLEGFFNKKGIIFVDDNPSEAVVLGATSQAAVWYSSKDSAGLLPLDILPLTLGIETAGGVMTTLIDRGTSTPNEKSRVFFTNQDCVTIKVFEGERSMAKDNHALGEFGLCGISPLPQAAPQIKVIFRVDSSEVLSVSAEDKSTGNMASFIVSQEDRLVGDEADRAINEGEKAVLMDDAAKRGVEAQLKKIQLGGEFVGDAGDCGGFSDAALRGVGLFVPKEKMQ